MVRLGMINDQLRLREVLLVVILLVDIVVVVIVRVGVIGAGEVPGDRRGVHVVDRAVQFHGRARLDVQACRFDGHGYLHVQLDLFGYARTTVGDLAFVDALVGQTNVGDLQTPVGISLGRRVRRDEVPSVGEKDLLADGQRQIGVRVGVVLEPGDVMVAEIVHVTREDGRVGHVERLIVGRGENARESIGESSCDRSANDHH